METHGSPDCEVPELIHSRDTRRADRLPPGQMLTRNWPVLHHGTVPRIETAQWSLTIDGAVETPVRLDWETFSRLPRARVHCDIHCVTTWSRLDNVFEGPSTASVMAAVRLLPEARFVLLHAYEGSGGAWSTNLSLEDFLGEDCLFALMHDGKPLTPHHGGPVRVVVPRLYFWKSAKWVRRVEVITADRPGFWEENGYHMRGDPWREERYRAD